MNAPASLTRSDVAGLTWVAVEGELDLAAVGIMEFELTRICQGRDHVVIDARPLRFIDLAGLRMLIALVRRGREDGARLSLVYGEPVRRLGGVCGLMSVLPPSEDPEQLLRLHDGAPTHLARDGSPQALRRRVRAECIRQQELVARMADLVSRALASAEANRRTVALVSGARRPDRSWPSAGS